MSENIPSAKELEALRINNRTLIYNQMISHIDSTNKLELEIHKFLTGTVSVIISILLLFVSNNELFKNLSVFDRAILRGSLAFLFISLLAGVAHLYTEHTFFKKSAGRAAKRLDIWRVSVIGYSDIEANNNLDKMAEEEKALPKSPEGTVPLWLFFQGLFALIGLGGVLELILQSIK